MSKSKKEPYADGISSSSLRRTVLNSPSTRRSEEHEGYSRTSRSKSSDSSPERKKSKFGKPVARGPESGIIFDKGELKKISITITNKLAKPPLVHFTNPETITPIRRPKMTDHDDIENERYEYRRRKSPSEPRRYEGKRPIFRKASKEDSDSSEDQTSTSRENPIEYRRKGESRKRYESPDHHRRRSRRNSSGSRKRRRNRSTPPRQRSCSSDSSSSSDRRRRKKHDYKIRPEREREEKKRREYESKMSDPERSHTPPLPANGGEEASYSQDKMNMMVMRFPPHPPPGLRMIYPAGGRMLRPPPHMMAKMRLGMPPPFGPAGPFPRVPPGFVPPPRPGYFPPAMHPRPIMPPVVPFRPMPRIRRPSPPSKDVNMP